MADGERSRLTSPQALGLAAALALAAQMGLAQKARAASAGAGHVCAKGSHPSKAFGREHSCSKDSEDLHIVTPAAGVSHAVTFGRTAAPCTAANNAACGPSAQPGAAPTTGAGPTFGTAPTRR